MWTGLGLQLDGILNPVVAAVAAALAAALVPLLAVWLTTWLIAEGTRLMTGGSSASVPDLARRAAFVIAIGLTATSAAFISGTLLDAWRGVRGQVAGAFAAAIPGGIADPSNAWAVLDTMGTRLDDVLMQLRQRASTLSWYELPEYLSLFSAYLILGLAGGLLQLVAGWLIMLSTFLGAFAIGLAPVFIIAAAFAFSRQWFMNWLTYVLNVAVLSAVAMFAIAVSLAMSSWAVARVGAMPGGLFGAAADYFGIVLMLSTVHVLLAVMVYQGPSITGQLLGAAGVGQGGGMLQTLLLLGRMGGISRAVSARSAAPSTAGSVSAPSAGYRAGRTLGYAYQRVAAQLRRR